MKRNRLLAFLLCFCMVFALLPGSALAATPNIMTIKITMTAPKVGKPLPTTAKTSSTANCEVTKVEWSGQLDENGNMAYDTEYTAVFTVEIKEGKDAKFTTADPVNIAKNSTLNGDYVIKSAERVSDTLVRLTYVLPAVKTPSTTVNKISISITKPSVDHSLATYATTSGSHTKVTKVQWSGELSQYGNAMYGVEYTAVFTVEIKEEYAHTFSTKEITATVNSNTAKVERTGDRVATVTYTFPAIAEPGPSAPTVDLSKTFSQAEANAKYPLANPITIVVSEDNQDMDYLNDLGGYPDAEIFNFLSANFSTLDGDVVVNGKDLSEEQKTYNLNRITRIVYDLYRKDDFTVTKYPNAKELWLSPKCDIQGILDNIGRQTYHSTFKTYDYTVFIPDTVYPNGPTYHTFDPPGCRVMLYSGNDVYAAAEKGASAAREWCTNHSYTAMIEQSDRRYTQFTCYSTVTYYYSCSKCGKCEYNPNHTFVSTLVFGAGGVSAHQCDEHIISDEHLLGFNSFGDAVYLGACEWCGKDSKQLDTASGEGAKWLPGGYNYEKAMTFTPVSSTTLYGVLVISADDYVSATVSGWARDEVQRASCEGLVDKELLGNNYTEAVNRLQFCSIVVKMAEKMTGKTIAPAPSGTFTDTDNEYVRKASAAGITSGVGDGSFNPNGTLDRQQMAAFIYKALQYVKNNSDLEYTIWSSKLSSYSDAGQIAGWATDPMAFMNALGLIGGTSDTTLSPGSSCTIEQALMVAYRSLDAAGIGWYQRVSEEQTGYNWPGVGRINYGDRIWFTSSDGDCVAPNGKECKADMRGFYPIKDR